MPPYDEIAPTPRSVIQESNQNTSSDNEDEIIAHVLFLDIVGFTKLPPATQVTVLGKLQEIIRANEDFCRARKAGELIALPTGDGMALAFLKKGVSGIAISCAEKIAESILNHNDTTSEPSLKINVRMGIHSGTVVRIKDINDCQNVAGDGINTAQRVMDCGDVGHILLSQAAFHLRPKMLDRTEQFRELGNTLVKHDQVVNLFSFSHDRIGSQTLPAKLLEEKQKAEKAWTNIKPILDKEARKQRLRWLLAILAIVVLLAITHYVSLALQNPGPPVTLYVHVLKAQTPKRYSSRAFSKGLTQDFGRTFRFLRPQQDVNSSAETSTPIAGTSAQADRVSLAIDVGRKKGARYVLTGTVDSDLENGDRAKLSAEELNFNVTINVELYDVASAERVFNKPYSTPFKNLIATQELVLKDVCNKLDVMPDTSVDAAGEAQAHLDYLVGRFWAFQRTNALETEKKIFTRRANKSYEMAKNSRLNPYYALALAGLADIKLSEGGVASDPKNAANEAFALLLEATKPNAQILGKQVAEPFAAVGTQKWWLQRDYLSAISAFELAIRLDSNLADSHKRYSSCLAAMGEEREALRHMNIALSMEGESPVFQLANAQNHFFARRYSDAIDQLLTLKETLAKDNEPPDAAVFRFLAMSREGNGQIDAALDELKSAEEQIKDIKDNPDFLSVKAHILVRKGRTAEAIKIAEDLERRSKEEYVSPYLLAVIYAPMPDQERKTLELLKRAKDEYDPRLNWANVDSRFREWQDRKDFTNILQEAGLFHPQMARPQ